MTHVPGHTREMELNGIDAATFDEIGVTASITRLALAQGAGQAPTGDGAPPSAIGQAIATSTAADARLSEARAAQEGLIKLDDGVFMDAVTRQVLVPTFISDDQGRRVEFRPTGNLNIVRSALGLTDDDDDTAAARNAATAEGNLGARFAELDEERRQADLDFDLEMRALDDNQAAEAANLDFLERKLAIDEEDGRRDDARATQTLITETRLAISGIAERRNTARANASARNADRSARAAEFNAQQAFQVGLENQRRIEENQRQQAAVAEQVAEFGAKPGDITKLVSFLGSGIARGGLGTALEEGEDFRTARSVAPLESARRRETELAAGPETLSFTPVQAQLEDLSQFGPIDQEALFNRLFAEFGGGDAGAAGAAGASALAGPQTGADAGAGTSLVESELNERGLDISVLPDFVRQSGALTPTIEAQAGFDGIVAEPTTLTVAEGGQPERVTVEPIGSDLTPLFGGGGLRSTINPDGTKTVTPEDAKANELLRNMLGGGMVGGNVSRDPLLDSGQVGGNVMADRADLRAVTDGGLSGGGLRSTIIDGVKTITPADAKANELLRARLSGGITQDFDDPQSLLGDVSGLPVDSLVPGSGQTGTAPFGGEARKATINFLNELALEAGRGTIFEGREFVSPVEVAAPGTGRGLRELAGAISSAGRGVDPGEFMNLILSLIPRALTEQPLRRTA